MLRQLGSVGIFLGQLGDLMPANEKTDWLRETLDAIPSARVTVFGDFCLDAYWLIDPDASELSVETGLPVRRVRQQRYSLGAAGNIVANLVALGVGHVRAVGLVARTSSAASCWTCWPTWTSTARACSPRRAAGRRSSTPSPTSRTPS